jgi:ligand-binding SRPBCC domain-containing protein
MAGSDGYVYQFELETSVEAMAADAFAFLSDPHTLPLLDPPWLRAQLLSAAAGPVRQGSEMEYIFRWSGIPVYLRLVVTEYESPLRLVLSQAQGPWQSFCHSITLHPAGNGTVVAERMQFQAAPGVFERLMHRLVVQRQSQAVVDFRKQALSHQLSRAKFGGELHRAPR